MPTFGFDDVRLRTSFVNGDDEHVVAISPTSSRYFGERLPTNELLIPDVHEGSAYVLATSVSHC